MSYFPVRINTLRPDDVICFDVFVQVGERYIHYIRRSDPFDGERIVRLKEKGVKKLFIQEDAEQDYLKYLDAGLDRLKDEKLAPTERLALVHDALVTDAENVSRNIENQPGYIHTEQRMKKAAEFLTSENGIVKNVLDSAGFSQDSFQHCANVSTLSVGLASLLGVTQTSELVELGIAALLHDIGYLKLDFNPRVSISELTLEQLNQFHRHPVIGAEMLSERPYINKKMRDLVSDHEEKGDGIGFPNKKRISTLSLPSQILNLCNEYDRYSFEKKISHKDAAKGFFQDRIGAFDLNHIKMLVTLFK